MHRIGPAQLCKNLSFPSFEPKCCSVPAPLVALQSWIKCQSKVLGRNMLPFWNVSVCILI